MGIACSDSPRMPALRADVLRNSHSFPSRIDKNDNCAKLTALPVVSDTTFSEKLG